MASSTFLKQIGSFLSGDILFFVVTFILFFVFTLYAGRGRMISFILAFYPASILYKSLPFLDELIFFHTNGLPTINKMVIFLILLVPISIIINRYVFSESEYSGSSHMIRTAGLALVATVLLVIFSYTVVNFDILHNFSYSVDVLFTPESRIFYWNFGIFAFLAFL